MRPNFQEIAVLQSRVAELEEELGHYRSVKRLNWTPHLFFLASLESGLVIYISRSCEDLLGRKAECLKHWPLDWLKLVHPDDHRRVVMAIRKFDRRQQQTPSKLEQEYRIVRPDGSVRRIRDRITVIMNQSGKSRWLVGMTHDISVD